MKVINQIRDVFSVHFTKGKYESLLLGLADRSLETIADFHAINFARWKDELMVSVTAYRYSEYSMEQLLELYKSTL